MGRVVYGMNVSLDGYIEDRSGDFGFSEPDPEVHRAANDQARDAGAFLFGRRLYEVMEDFWTKAAAAGEGPDVELEFARLYVATPRIVFSDTLETVPQGVRLVRSHDARAEVERLKAEVDGELSIGGAALAASVLDLIDEVRPFVMPVLVGGGKPFLPVDHQLRLRLIGHRVFASGTTYLQYEPER
jgi:dihydrofolate reductase